ncbi:ATP-binding protein [Streptomyces sp. NPDC051561]|uniref:ATP-binding protein n=1 Tax=Streptomyces sp. NPDC051561 TaxID=3365658 RepID=UPI0037B622C6
MSITLSLSPDYSPPSNPPLCPALDPPDENPADALALSVTLPAEPRSAAIARTAVAAALDAYHLDRHTLAATLVITELIATAARLAPHTDLYLSLRHRDDILRLVLWDQHPPHLDPDTRTVCTTRRIRSLWLLSVTVEDWGGEWGITPSTPPHQGTKTWVNLPS